MKKVLLICVIVFFAAIANNSWAQKDTTLGQKMNTGAKKTGKAIGKGAKAVGNKTAELASKGSSAVVDKVYDSKVGPGGQTIYINKNSHYYWVDKKGRRHYVKEAMLKAKE